MMLASKKRLGTVLGILQFVIGVGAVPAGISMILDPTGAGLGMSTGMLAGSPFSTFFIPGVVLLLVNGIGSLTGGVLTFTGHQRASLVAIGLGAFLMAWIIVQVLSMGPPLHWLQVLYFVLGGVELILGWQLNRAT
jgi:hypothetical protein